MTIYAIVGISIISVFFILDIVFLAINVKELSQKTIHGFGNWRGTILSLSLLLCLTCSKDLVFDSDNQTLTIVLLNIGTILMMHICAFWANYEKIIVKEAGFYYRRKGRMAWIDFKNIGDVIYNSPSGYAGCLEVYDNKNNCLIQISWPDHVDYFLSAKDDYFKNHSVAECPPQFVAKKTSHMLAVFAFCLFVLVYFDVTTFAIAWSEYPESNPLVFWIVVPLVIAILTALFVAMAIFFAKIFNRDYIEFDGETLFFGRKKRQPYKVEDLSYDIKVHKKSKMKKITILDKKTNMLLFKSRNTTISNSHLLIKLLQSSSLNQH